MTAPRLNPDSDQEEYAERGGNDPSCVIRTILSQLRASRPRGSGRGRSDLLGQPSKLTLRTRPDVQIPAADTPGHAAPGVAEQMCEAAPEPGLIQARAFLPSSGSSPE